MLEISLAILLSLLAATGLAANILGLPGNWLIVVLAIGCAWLPAESQSYQVSWLAVVFIFAIAMLGELFEFLAAAMGARRLGGSKRGTALSVIGSMVGAIVGLFIGLPIPIPVIGVLVSSLLLGASGAYVGAIAGERWAGREWEPSLQVGTAAFWGRLLGTVGKVVCGTIATAFFLVAIWW